MVAYTYPDCLPYYECSDSPCLNTGTECEPSNVFCDMTAQLEIILNQFDSTLARTGTGVPFAKVARSAPQVFPLAGNITGTETFGFQIQWDTVIVDNDNMVNLDADNRYIKINRPGIWWMELFMVGQPDTAANNELTSFIVQRGGFTGNVPGLALSEATSRWRFSSAGAYINNVENRASYAYQIPASTLATNGTIDIGSSVQAHGVLNSANNLTVTYAEMTVYWTAESTV